MVQVENYRDGVAQGAGADFRPGREKRERGFPWQSPEPGTAAWARQQGYFTSFNVTPAGNEGKTSPLGIGVWEHWQLARPKSKAK